MRALYIFPHPDDECFGPAPAIVKQRRQGHDVYLLTLTRGGNTRQRFKFGYTERQMCEVRAAELREVARVLDLSGLTVLDFPDGGLQDVDPTHLELAIESALDAVRPAVVITYPVHGVSGYNDHLVAHAVVKRAYVSTVARGATYLRRLAFFTRAAPTEAPRAKAPGIRYSGEGEIDCLVTVDDEDVERSSAALDCYESYADVVERSGIRRVMSRAVAFEFFQERHTPPLQDVFESLDASRRPPATADISLGT